MVVGVIVVEVREELMVTGDGGGGSSGLLTRSVAQVDSFISSRTECLQK